MGQALLFTTHLCATSSEVIQGTFYCVWCPYRRCFTLVEFNHSHRWQWLFLTYVTVRLYLAGRQLSPWDMG